MKLLLALALFTASARAETLVDCSPYVGPDQGITLKREEGKIILVELDYSGRFYSRQVTAPEWRARKMALRADYRYGSGTTYFFFAEGDWQIRGPGSYGTANCDVY